MSSNRLAAQAGGVGLRPEGTGQEPSGSAQTSGLVAGGRTLYGLALGIMMLDTTFPRLPGDIGNASTWPFPVMYRIVPEARPERLVQPEADPALLEPFINVAKELESLGVPAITTSCGFLAAFQKELSEAVSVPVFSSALLQVPAAAAVLRSGQRVAILTAKAVLNDRHFTACGWSEAEIPVIQTAPSTGSHFFQTFVQDTAEAEPARLEREVGELTERVLREHADVGAIVLECANFSPFSPVIKKIAGVPVFDLYTLAMQAVLVTTATANTSSASPSASTMELD